MNPSVLQFIAVCFSGLACLISTLACWTSYRAYRRQGSWKESDDAKAMAATVSEARQLGKDLDVRVSQAEAICHNLTSKLDDAKRLDFEAEARQRVFELRLNAAERELDVVPTQQEFERLSGKVDTGFAELRGEIKLERELMVRVEKTLHRIEEGMLKP